MQKFQKGESNTNVELFNDGKASLGASCRDWCEQEL